MKKFCSHVDGAKNGEIALKMVREQGPYDIVLTDVRMPKMSGWALARELKNVDPNIFVAVMTGSPEMDGICTEDCDIYMAKPIDIEKMQLMLEALIEKKGL
jgi:YesN/AraC family two-component response regulator